MTSAVTTKCLSVFPLPPRATVPQSYRLSVMTCLIIYAGESEWIGNRDCMRQ